VLLGLVVPGGVVFRPLVVTVVSQPRYTAHHLSCAAFLEEVSTTVEAQRGMTPIRERGYRSGVLVFRAREAGAALRFEAWYDSLVVWHETQGEGGQGRLTPETDGLIGGRWRGTLTPAGEVSLEVRPFLPPELAAVAHLADVPLDFLPPLPRDVLIAGRSWTGADGLVIERLADSAGAERYRWRLRTRERVAGFAGDSSLVLQQEIEDGGQLVWTDATGVWRWQRVVTVETRLPAGPRLRTPVQGRVEQRIAVRRALVRSPEGC
jgi:hypothetical protein